MNETMVKIYRIDGDTLEVIFELDHLFGAWIGDYPFFEEEPRITPSGRPWCNVTYDSCLHAAGTHGDCGTCPHLLKQSANDLIGVCFHDALRQRQ